MPPGAIGSRQLQRGGPLPGFYQPVEIKAPAGALVSLANGDRFVPRQAVPRRVGLLIGSVYRLRVTNIPMPEGGEGLEVFPTIEVIDRLYAPLGQECRFAIPVELTHRRHGSWRWPASSSRASSTWKTRTTPCPAREIGKSQHWFEVAPGQDPLAAADRLGRPVAILRLGGRLPDAGSRRRIFLRLAAVPALPAAPAAEVRRKRPRPRRRRGRAACPPPRRSGKPQP